MSDYYEDLANDLARTERYEQPEEETVSDNNSRQFTNDEIPVRVEREHGYNPYHGPRLPLLTEEEIIARASYWDREWEAKSGASKRGWRKAHRNPRLSLMTPALVLFFLAACVVVLGWWVL